MRNIFLWNIYLDRLEIFRVPEYKNLIDQKYSGG